MAGEEGAQHLPHLHRLFRPDVHDSHSYRCDFGYQHLPRHAHRLIARPLPAHSHAWLPARPFAIRAHVGTVHRLVCLYAQHPCQASIVYRSWNTCGSCNAMVAVGVYTFTDLGVILQCNLWFVCSPSALYALGADIVDDMPIRSGTLLYESKPRLL